MFFCIAPTSNQAMRMHVEHSARRKRRVLIAATPVRINLFATTASVCCTVSTLDDEPWCPASRQCQEVSLPVGRDTRDGLAEGRSTSPRSNSSTCAPWACLYPLEQRCLRIVLAPQLYLAASQPGMSGLGIPSGNCSWRPRCRDDMVYGSTRYDGAKAR